MIDAALKPFSKIYRAGMSLRAYLYHKGVFQSYKPSIPVISVGNISAGGTGKTPMCIFLAKSLSAKGFKPVILSRGYKGGYKGVHLVSRSDKATLCGDEPLLMAQSLDHSVVVSRDRVEGAKFIEDKQLGDLIILDDGLQHLRIKRDIDIVLLNIGSAGDIADIEGNRVIPMGHLREDRDAALSRSDFVVLSARTAHSKAPVPSREFLKMIPAGKIIVSSFFEPSEISPCAEGEIFPNVKEVVAFCGIAKPEGFFSGLEGMGLKIQDKVARSDHHVFSSYEIQNIKNRYPGLPLVCTEKDAVRLPEKSRPGIFKLQGAIKIIPEDAFIVQLEKRLKSL